jgi:spore maturation protein CgeB
VRLVIYGLSITSSWGNGHATTYRALVRAMAARGHSIVFVEKDVEWYRSHRDPINPEICTVLLYEDWSREASRLLQASAGADAVMIGSYFSDAIAATLGLLERNSCPLLFYDIDTPITMAALRGGAASAYLDASLIPHYAAYLSFTGGGVLRELEERFGSPRAVPFYCSVDPDLYQPAALQDQYCCDLGYLVTYAADRQDKLVELLNKPASALALHSFIVAGPQYPQEVEWPSNVRRIEHLAPAEHPAFYSSSRFTLNLTRADMILAGYSPSVRIFEASACGCAILSDRWNGIEEFLTPGQEILLVNEAKDVIAVLEDISEEQRIRIGRQARERILSQHTSAHRVAQLEQLISELSSKHSVF